MCSLPGLQPRPVRLFYPLLTGLLITENVVGQLLASVPLTAATMWTHNRQTFMEVDSHPRHHPKRLRQKVKWSSTPPVTFGPRHNPVRLRQKVDGSNNTPSTWIKSHPLLRGHTPVVAGTYTRCCGDLITCSCRSRSTVERSSSSSSSSSTRAVQSSISSSSSSTAAV